MTKKLGVFSLGVAIFSMFFGAGNIVFPLILGRAVEGKISYALLGFILTAVIVPILGFCATLMFAGDYEDFFSTIGRVPARCVIALCMFMLGPLGASRCVVLSYSAISEYLHFSLFTYTLIAAVVIFMATYKESKVVEILGRVLGPIKLLLLFSIIFFVMITFKKLQPTQICPITSFFSGLKEGYFTLDLIGGIFFAHLIYGAMKNQNSTKPDLKNLISKGAKAALLGGILLAIVYAGFGLIAALHGREVLDVPKEKLFAALSTKILGGFGGILANVTIAVATLTTAIALTTVFADYLCFEVFKKKIPYIFVLAMAIGINIGMENLQFNGLMALIGPIATLIYPSFIVLSLANIFNKFFGFKYIKSLVLITFILTIAFQFFICL